MKLKTDHVYYHQVQLELFVRTVAMNFHGVTFVFLQARI